MRGELKTVAGGGGAKRQLLPDVGNFNLSRRLNASGAVGDRL